ncbi:hypothetical protein MRX96_051723 [Rhipicephalus microplus]
MAGQREAKKVGTVPPTPRPPRVARRLGAAAAATHLRTELERSGRTGTTQGCGTAYVYGAAIVCGAKTPYAGGVTFREYGGVGVGARAAAGPFRNENKGSPAVMSRI